MELTRTAQAALSALTSYARFATFFLVFFLLTPFVIRSVGPEQFGLWSYVLAVVGFFELLDLGFGVAVVKYVAECGGSGDVGRRNRLVSTLFGTYLGLAAVATVALALAECYLDQLFDIPPAQRPLASTLLWLLAARSVVLGLPLGLWRGVLIGFQRQWLVNAIGAAATVGYGLAAWWVLQRGGGLVALATVNLVALLAENLAYVAAAHRCMPDLRVSLRLWEPALFREALSFSLTTFAANVAGLVLLRTDPLIVKAFLPLGAVAAYALALKLVQCYHMVLKQFVNVLGPLAAEFKRSGDEQKLRFILVNCTRYALAPAVALGAPLLLYGRPFILAWVGPSFVEAVPVLLVLTVATALSTAQMVASALLTMTGHHHLTARAAVVSTLLNVGLSVLLAGPCGLLGVALGTLLTTVVVDLLWVVRAACARHGVPVADYLRRAVAPALLPAIPQVALALVLGALAPPATLPAIAAQGALGASAYALAFWRWSVEPTERLLFTERLLRFRRAPAAAVGEAA